MKGRRYLQLVIAKMFEIYIAILNAFCSDPEKSPAKLMLASATSSRTSRYHMHFVILKSLYSLCMLQDYIVINE